MKRADIFGSLPNSAVKQLIDEHIRGQHAERNRAVLKRRLIDGTPLERIAEEFELSVMQIKRIVYGCEEMLAQCMKPPNENDTKMIRKRAVSVLAGSPLFLYTYIRGENNVHPFQRKSMRQEYWRLCDKSYQHSNRESVVSSLCGTIRARKIRLWMGKLQRNLERLPAISRLFPSRSAV